jgi:hypothetical protein
MTVLVNDPAATDAKETLALTALMVRFGMRFVGQKTDLMREYVQHAEQERRQLQAEVEQWRGRHAALLYQYNACHDEKAALQDEVTALQSRLAEVREQGTAMADEAVRSCGCGGGRGGGRRDGDARRRDEIDAPGRSYPVAGDREAS